LLDVLLWILSIGFVAFFVSHGLQSYIFLHRLGYTTFPPSFKSVLNRYVRSKILEVILEDLKQRKSPKETLSHLFSLVAEIVRADAWSLLLTPERGDWDFYVWSDPYDRIELHQVAKQIQKTPAKNIRRVIATKKPMVFKVHSWKFNQRLKAWLGMPVMLEGKVAGVLNLDWFRPKSQLSLKYKSKIVEHIVNDISQVIPPLFHLHEILLNSRMDPVTETYNRTALEEYRANLRNTSYTVIFIDLDGFKRVNDSSGHRVGDLVLLTLAKRIQRTIRPDDLLVRYGGDEFVVITRAKEKGLESLINRLQSAVEAPVKIDGKEFHVGISIGTALVPEEASSIEEAIELADKRMYENKRTKNRDRDWKVESGGE